MCSVSFGEDFPNKFFGSGDVNVLEFLHRLIGIGLRVNVSSSPISYCFSVLVLCRGLGWVGYYIKCN